MKARWAVFLSGRGSNAQAAFEELHQLDVALCVSSKQNVLGIARARRAGIPVLILDKKPDWQKLHHYLVMRRIDRIMLLGFMKILPEEFCNLWSTKIWNLHPSLLPNFKGAEAIERSYAEGKSMGVSIHKVTSEMDAGLVLKQRCISQAAKMDFKDLSRASLRISQAEQSVVRKFMQDMNLLMRGLR